MARAGIYFSDVKQARDALIAKGRRPSIDAIRAALGDTGSKSTIHKYLRELDSQEAVSNVPVSTAISGLISQLAEQLKAEAAVEVDKVNGEMAALKSAHADAMAANAKELDEVRKAADALVAQLAATQADLAATKKQLQDEQIARHTAEQHTEDLSLRLTDAERHQASLEDKHRHARDALEHYRTAAKEQRERDSRRHEEELQTVQAALRQAQLTVAVKQEDVTRLNKEGAALVNELAANKEALYRERETVRNMTWKVAQLPVAESRIAVLEHQLAESRTQMANAEQAAAQAQDACTELGQQKAVLETALAHAQASRALEDRLARLDDAVFGRKTPDTAT